MPATERKLEGPRSTVGSASVSDDPKIGLESRVPEEAVIAMVPPGAVTLPRIVTVSPLKDTPLVASVWGSVRMTAPSSMTKSPRRSAL